MSECRVVSLNCHLLDYTLGHRFWLHDGRKLAGVEWYMSSDQHQRNSRTLYLVLVVVAFSCLCAVFNMLVYGVPIDGRPVLLDDNITVLVIASVVLATINGVFSDLIANWILEGIQILPSRRRSITKVLVVIVFIISLGLGVFFAVALR